MTYVRTALMVGKSLTEAMVVVVVAVVVVVRADVVVEDGGEGQSCRDGRKWLEPRRRYQRRYQPRLVRRRRSRSVPFIGLFGSVRFGSRW